MQMPSKVKILKLNYTSETDQEKGLKNNWEKRITDALCLL